ncbi:MAG: MlaC/ttg2D family ABC transporter substrate-binding protein [Burkholderiaceae bacterium]
MTSPLLDLQKFRSVFLGLVAVAMLTVAGPASAQTQGLAPDALVKKLTEEVLATVKTDKDIQSGNINKIQSLVETTVLPYVNFQKMTASAVGRNWSTATPEQQKQITDQFRQLLVYTYSGALTEVRDQQVQYKPFRADPADTVVQVNTQIVNTRGGEPITLNYRLEKGSDGWKIIDVNVLGVWLVENYRNTFQQEVSKGGVDGLIKALTEKNRSLATSSSRRKS